jgi:hypothetical protein
MRGQCLFSYAVNSPATADSARANAKKRNELALIVYHVEKANPSHTLEHHSHVKRYPVLVVSGGKRFQMRFRRLEKISSVVTSRAARYVARENTINSIIFNLLLKYYQLETNSSVVNRSRRIYPS